MLIVTPLYTGYHGAVYRRVRQPAKTTISFVKPVRLSAWNNSASNRRIFTTFHIRVFFECLSRKFKFC